MSNVSFHMMTPGEVEAWAAAYSAAAELPSPKTPDDPNWPYIQHMMPGLSYSLDCEDIWQIILAVVASSPSDKVLGALAAGPLEDLVEYAGDQFIDRIEVEARRSPAFRALLGGVWESGSESVWSRLEKARNGARW